MELDDTDVFESDDRGEMTIMIDELDPEAKAELRGKMRYLKRYARDEDAINTKRLLNIIIEIGEINPPYLRRHLKLVSEILCRVIKSGQPQMVLRGYQTIRNLSQILKSPFSVTYWKYLKLSFSNLLSPVQAIVDYALQMIYEMHSSFDPTYFIKTLRSVLLQTQNVNLKINFAICLYQLLCHQKSNITQYCPTYFELFILMTDKSKTLKQVCKETGKYLKELYGIEDLKNMMITYYKVGRIRRIQEVLCLKLVSDDGDIEPATTATSTSLNESSIRMEDDSIEDNTNRRISTTSDASEAEAKMASIAIGQHKFVIKKQSPTLIPAAKPYYPKENKRKSVISSAEVEERSKSAPSKEEMKQTKEQGPHQRTISKTIERSRSVRPPYKSIVGKSDTSAYQKKVERIRKSIMRSATAKNKSPVKYKTVKSKTIKKQPVKNEEPSSLNNTRKSTTSQTSNRRSPSRASSTKATIQKIMAKARKEREEKAAGRKVSPKKNVKNTKKEEEKIKQQQVEKEKEEEVVKEEQPSIEIPKLEEERAIEEEQQQEQPEEDKVEEGETSAIEDQQQATEIEENVKPTEEEEDEFADETPEEVQLPLEPAAPLEEPSPLADESPKVEATEEEKPVEEEVKPVEEEVKPAEEEKLVEEEKPVEEEKLVEEEKPSEEEEEVKPVEEEEKPTEEEQQQEKEADDIVNEAVEEEEEEEGDEEKTAKEMLEELLASISPEDRIKYQNELMVLGAITDYFDSDSDYDSYSEDDYDDEEEEEEVKEKLPTLSEKDENIEEEDEEEDDKDIKNWNIFDSDYEEVSDDESYTGEDPVLPGDEEDN